MIKAFFILLMASAAIAAQSAPAAKPSAGPNGPAEAQTPKKSNARPAATPIAPVKKQSLPGVEPFDKADVKTMAGQCVTLATEAGAITLEVYPESAPEAVRNFLNLAAIGAFDTTTFARVVPGFVIQGGNLSTGDKWTLPMSKRAARRLPDEPNAILHERGVVSMARGDEPDSATTHFFILVSTAPSLDRKFAAFGRVTSGMEVVEAINKAPVLNEKPDKPVKIKKATVAACAAPPVN